jgi:hypothetical protein
MNMMEGTEAMREISIMMQAMNIQS